MKFVKFLEKQQSTWFLLSISTLFSLLRLPSLFEPLWNTDEGIYQLIGHALRSGRLLYTGIWDNKPPLLYYIYAIFNGDQFSVRLLSLLLGILCILLFFYIAKEVLKSPKVIYSMTTVFALLLGTPLFLATTANAENFILPLSLAAFWLFLKTEKARHVSLRAYGFIGFLLGLAFMIKFTAIFELIAVMLLCILQKPLREKITRVSITRVLIGFVIPFAVFSFVFLIRGTFGAFISSAFLTNVDYVSYGNSFIFPFGWLILRIVLAVLALWLIVKRRRQQSFVTSFVGVWFVLELFGVLFSSRPYEHYVILLFPSMLLVFGLLFQGKYTSLKYYLFLSVICLIGLSLYFSPHWSVFPYYGNFLKFVSGQESVESYRQSFDKGLQRDYSVAAFLKNNLNTGDSIEVWGDKPQLYTLVGLLPPGQLTVAYHVFFMKGFLQEEGEALRKASPKFVIVYPGEGGIPYNMRSYDMVFTIQGVTVYEKSLAAATK